MKRTRSVLIDATIGKIFTNAVSAQQADPSKIIAGTKLASTSIISSKSSIAKITKNLSGSASGIRFPSGCLLVSITVTAATAPLGAPITFDIKSGTTYENSIVISTVSLKASYVKDTYPVALTIQPGNAIYVDIKQVGSVRPGNGVTVQFNYYSG